MSSSDCNGSKGKKPVIFQLPCYISAILDFDEALPTIAGSGDVPGDAASTGIPSQSDALKPERWAEPESRPAAGL